VLCVLVSLYFLRTEIQIAITRCHILRLKCTKIDFFWGFAPPHIPLGSLQRSPTPTDPLAGFKRPSFNNTRWRHAAVLRVLSDALTTADDRQVTLIALLDLSSAFDCVDHELLLRRLQYNFGFTDDVLRWMSSFVSCRTQQVSYDGPAVAHSSSTVRSSTGVRPPPPILRHVYTLPT